MATVHRLPLRPLARDGSETNPRATDYRAAVERLLAAGVTGSAAIAAALNAEPLYTPPGTAASTTGRGIRTSRPADASGR